ncbi:FxLYD domain-containing protein [Halococcus sp. PRR34]|uniref:FxLYD domain-containing protein n=1 Tax=Halococcus sp. PRR34 TaxID=3020830 RepID=UPI0023621832|nr:FxLYD domain-containing protein [Halococcus sp. PRR34]
METGITAEVTNTGDTRLSYIEVQAAFRNEAGDILDTNYTNVVGLKSGQTWEAYVSYLGDETVADAELEVADTTAGELAPPPEGVELIEDSLEPPEDEFGSPSVVGRAENGSDSSVDYLQAMVSFVAENGNLLSSGSTNVSNLPGGETWRFEVEYLAISPNKPDEPSDYTVTLTTSIQ